MDKKRQFGQPLMMRKDYGDTGDKEALMYKQIPIEESDKKKPQESGEEYLIDDYDSHRCGDGCFLCDR